MNIKSLTALLLFVVLSNYLFGCSDCGTVTDHGLKCGKTYLDDDPESRELRKCCRQCCGHE